MGQKGRIAGTIVAGALTLSAVTILLLTASIDFSALMQKMVNGMRESLSAGEMFILFFTDVLFFRPAMAAMANYILIIVAFAYSIASVIITAGNAGNALSPKLRGWNVAILVIASFALMASILLFAITLGTRRNGGGNSSGFAAIIGFLAR